MTPTGDTLRRCFAQFILLFDATPPASPVEWCECNLMVPDPARGGMRHWQGALYPHHHEILLDWAADEVREIVIVGAAQAFGKTVVATGCCLYSAAVERISVLWMMPTISLAEEIGESRVQAAISASSLSEWFYPPASRTAKNTKLVKSFPGGKIELIGSNSPASLRARASARLIADDVDSCEGTDEGDSVQLFRKRSAGVQDGDTKFLLISSPAHVATSKIWPAYLSSSQAIRRHACPHCGKRITLEGTPEKPFRAIRWKDGDASTATFYCTECDHNISETERLACFFASDWEHEQPENKKRGYRMGAAYLPWTKRGTHGQAHAIIAEWLEAKEDHDMRRVVINTVMALPFTEIRVEFTWEALAKTKQDADWRTERHPDTVFLTCGVDTQDDRLVAVILGHDSKGAVWVVDYVVIMGTPRMPEHERHAGGVWLELDAWRRAYSPVVTLVDHGGHCAREVALYCGPRSGEGVYASKGSNRHNAPTVTIGKAKPVGNALKIRLYMLGTVALKDSLEQRVTNGRINFPGFLPDSFFRELCAEHPVTEIRSGHSVRKWELKPGEFNNHALDCCVYGLAAAAVASAQGKLKRYAMPKPGPLPQAQAENPTPAQAPPTQATPPRRAAVLRNSFVRRQ